MINELYLASSAKGAGWDPWFTGYLERVGRWYAFIVPTSSFAHKGQGGINCRQHDFKRKSANISHFTAAAVDGEAGEIVCHSNGHTLDIL